MLKQVECDVQNEPITKNEVLPVSTLFFRKFCFSTRTYYKGVDLKYQLPKCPYSYFPKALEFYLRVLFPCEYP